MAERARKVLVGVLAAGRSSRMGFPKLLEPYDGGEGSTCLLVRACGEALASEADGVAVVLGAYGHEAIVALEDAGLAGERRLTVLVNNAWNQGQATSVAALARHARQSGVDGLVVMAADQPYVRVRHIDALIRAFRSGLADGGDGGIPRALRSQQGTRQGNPCLFPREAFSLLEGLSGDEGARQLFRNGTVAAVPVDVCKDEPNGAPNIFLDLDTPEEFEAFVEGRDARNISLQS